MPKLVLFGSYLKIFCNVMNSGFIVKNIDVWRNITIKILFSSGKIFQEEGKVKFLFQPFPDMEKPPSQDPSTKVVSVLSK